MKGKLNGSISDLKLQVFSSHDDNMSAMLLALTSIYMPRPPYSSTIVFELHQLQNKTGAVRVLHLNSTTPEIDVGYPHVLNLKGCSEFCPLDKFAKITQKFTPDDWEAECQEQSQKKLETMPDDSNMRMENTTLLLVQTLFRHGDRAPIKIYPGYQNNIACCPEGFGKLSLIAVNSSASDRCLRSAEANIASFYAPEGIWKFEGGLDWQPIPVHYLPYSQDKESFDDMSQHAGFNVSDGLYTMAFYDALLADKSLVEQTGSMFFSISTSTPLEDYILPLKLDIEINITYSKKTVSQRIHNLPFPSWVEPYWTLLQKSVDMISHCFYNSPDLLRLRAGPLLQAITENMKGKISGSITDLKLQVFSAHEDNVGSMLLALTSTLMPRPPYSATIVFELHQLQDKTGAVRVLYLNSTTPEIDVGKPHVLNLKGCSDLCPLDKFVKITMKFIPDDWDAECQQPAKKKSVVVSNSTKAELKQQFQIFYH
ncbi:prostatic acid phosphatase-like [Argiope bruennichi]|uniref:prostatic acid phosphatase-like n=1 Tax=Argiope bruennichi TaxID=94029 RepID=UPI0024958D9B|nr:prostatic acid phosphatase-like [Argiope bruennichi]